jgi:hypothetical protein
VIPKSLTSTAPTFFALAAVLFAFFSRLAFLPAALFTSGANISAIRAVLLRAQIGADSFATMLSELALFSTSPARIVGGVQIPARLIGRDTARFPRRAGKMASAAILVCIQSGAVAIAAGFNWFVAGRFARCSVRATGLTIAFLAVADAHALPAAAILTIAARCDTCFTTALLAVRTVGHAASLGRIADLAFRARNTGISATGLAWAAVIGAAPGRTDLAALALVDANTSATLLAGRAGRFADAIDRVELFAGGAFVI